MGYTHYWTIGGSKEEWEAIFSQLLRDAARIIHAADIELIGPLNVTDAEGNPVGSPPLLDRERGILLNGVDDEGHENFRLLPLGSGFAFCKTARKPYDLVVTCILLRAYMLAPCSIDVGSDGYWSEWMLGRKLYGELWPDAPAKCPWGEADAGLQVEDSTELNASKL